MESRPLNRPHSRLRRIGDQFGGLIEALGCPFSPPPDTGIPGRDGESQQCDPVICFESDRRCRRGLASNGSPGRRMHSAKSRAGAMWSRTSD